MSLKSRIAAAFAATPGITQAGLARACGISRASVNAWVHGQTESIDGKYLTTAALYMQVDAHWLATGEGEMTPSITTGTVKVSAGDMPDPLSPLTIENHKSAKNDDKLTLAGRVTRGRLVPVVGMARLGDNGFYEEISSISGAGDGMVEAYSNDPDAYALRVRGDSMFPAIRDGWFVVVEPGSTPAPGDYVLIKLKSGQKMIKELIMRRPDGITVMSVNGDLRRTIEAEEIDPDHGVQSVGAIVSPRKWLPE